MRTIESELSHPDSVVAIAINKETREIIEIIAYETSNKEPVLSIINSIYWNHTKYRNGLEIVKSMNFLTLHTEQEKERFKTLSQDEVLAMSRPYSKKSNP